MDQNEAREVQSPRLNLLTLQQHQRNIRKDKKIKIDVGKTQYPLLRTVATSELGWKVWTHIELKDQINVYWNDTYVTDEFIRRLKPYQRINHFPGSQILGKKNLLSTAINRMKKTNPKEFNFFPSTFNFPEDIQEFEKQKTPGEKYYIVKPNAQSQGKGIFLTKTPDIVSKEDVVVQQYIQNPLLIEGVKFDLRLYVVLRSLSPLRVYIFDQGLGRLATCEYQAPSPLNQKNMLIHLTNYAINKASPNFIFNKSELQDDVGHKRSLSAVFQVIEKLGCDTAKLWSQIDAIIVKTFISVHENMSKRYRQCRQGKQDQDSVCFQILGFDILLRQDFKPILLEVNHSPSFCTQTPLDLIIKKYLLLDTLSLLSLNREDKTNYMKSKNQQENIHTNQILKNYAKNSQKQIDIGEVGAFRKIYPLESNINNQELIQIYDQLFKLGRKDKQRVKLPLSRPILPAPSRIPFSCQKVTGQPLFTNRVQRVDRAGDRASKSLSFYHVLSTLKRTKLTKLKQAIQFQQLMPSRLMANEKQEESEEYINQHQNRRSEVIMYDRKMNDKERKKYVAPMPVNSINIKLDEKFTHRHREPKSFISEAPPMPENRFKIHSMFNTTSQRKRGKDDGFRTPNKNTRQPPTTTDEQFRMTETTGSFGGNHSYSIELKQKIQKMQLARLRIQKLRKSDKASFMIIRSQVPQKSP